MPFYPRQDKGDEIPYTLSTRPEKLVMDYCHIDIYEVQEMEIDASRVMSISSNCKSRTRAVCPILRDFLILLIFWPMVFPVSSFILTCNIAAPFWTNISPFFFILRGSVCYNGTNTSPLLNYTMGARYKTNKRRLENGTFWKEKRSKRTKTD